MAGVRSGLRQRVVPSSGDKDKHSGIGEFVPIPLVLLLVLQHVFMQGVPCGL